METFIATVHLVFTATDEHDAADAVSGMLSENLMESGVLLDWGYAPKDGVFCTPKPIPVDVVNYTEGDYSSHL